jgi:glycosyltransferase involved in cell wall biosynthesis
MTAETAESRALRNLAGATVLQALPAMRDDQAGRATLEMAIALLRSGARALVAAAGGALVGELQALGGEWIEFNFDSSGVWRRRRTAQSLAEILRSERVDLVHALGPEPARLCLPAVKSARSVLVTSYLGVPPAAGWRRSPEDAQARGHLVLACSHFAADLIAERHRIPRERIAVIPRPVDTDWFDPRTVDPQQVAALKESWRIRPEVRVVLAPGRLIESQGQLILVDAVRSLVNGGLRGVAFVIAGDRPTDEAYVAQVDARIAAQGLAPLVRRVGNCADMPAAYAAADVVVLPILRSPIFSTTLMEAQAMGRPVVATNSGAIPELIEAPLDDETGPRTGWLVEPDNALDLARGIADALALDGPGLRGVGAQARRRAVDMYAPEQVTGAALSVYGWLLQRDE